MDGIPYANIIDSIMYVMDQTHPNITYIVSVVSMFMYNPRRVHCKLLSGLFFI